MKRLVGVALACAILLKAILVNGQYYFYDDKYYNSGITIEVGSSGGILNSLTDLGGKKGIGKPFIKDLNWNVTEPAFSFFLTSIYKDVLSLRLEASFGHISSHDSLLKKTDPDLISRYGRNLSFRTSIADFQLAAEIHPFFLKRYIEDESSFWSPYLLSGIGYFLFNPQALLQGHWYDLHPLRLEGQGFAEYPGRKPYKLRQFNIPIGIGIRYETGPLLHIRFEIVHRILFTDYLDDVSTSYIDASLFSTYLSPLQSTIATRLYSRMQELQPGYRTEIGMQRGDPGDKDAFFSIQLKAGWVIRKRRK
jgi:hypothetical protein